MEADAEREDDIERMHRHAGMEQMQECSAQKVRVLETAKEPDIRAQADDQSHAPLRAFACG